MRIDGNGYLGTLCVDGAGCQSGREIVFNLPPGSYTMFAGYSVEGNDSSLGGLELNGDGTVVPHADLLPFRPDASGQKLVANVTEMTVQFAMALLWLTTYCCRGGELVQPGGHGRGEQPPPHPGQVNVGMSRRAMPQGGAELAVAEQVLHRGAMTVPVLRSSSLVRQDTYRFVRMNE